MNTRITVKQASEMMKVSQAFIRIALQQGRLDIGTAVKMSSRWCYYITEEKVLRYLNN